MDTEPVDPAHLTELLRDAQTTGIAIGVLLARTPGWTERDAVAAWERACAQLTRDGNCKALASYVIQTGQLPGQGVPAPAARATHGPPFQ